MVISISRQQKKHTCPNKLPFAITFELIDHKWLSNPGRIARPIPAKAFKFQQKPKSKAISCGVFRFSRVKRVWAWVNSFQNVAWLYMSIEAVPALKMMIRKARPISRSADTLLLVLHFPTQKARSSMSWWTEWQLRWPGDTWRANRKFVRLGSF